MKNRIFAVAALSLLGAFAHGDTPPAAPPATAEAAPRISQADLLARLDRKDPPAR